MANVRRYVNRWMTVASVSCELLLNVMPIYGFHSALVILLECCNLLYLITELNVTVVLLVSRSPVRY